MKTIAKCFKIVLVTYISMCAVAWGSHFLFLKSNRADVAVAVLAAVVICVAFSVVGVYLSRQPENEWKSFAVTVFSSWFMALLLNNILRPVMTSASWLYEAVNITSIVLGLPGFIFGMMLGEYFYASTFLVVTVYILCGVIPPVVTIISAKIKK
ncbi:MAG: hypothetical protein UHM85_06700 [Acutalibacteraceae bacterium]|nr:hypothetical protein [Acutalibacteraceae bacterium]